MIKKIIKSIQEVLYVFFLKAMKATKTSPRFETSEKRIWDKTEERKTKVIQEIKFHSTL